MGRPRRSAAATERSASLFTPASTRVKPWVPFDFLVPIFAESAIRKTQQAAERKRRRMGPWREELEAIYKSFEDELTKGGSNVPRVLLTDVVVKVVYEDGSAFNKAQPLHHVVRFNGRLSKEQTKTLLECYQRTVDTTTGLAPDEIPIFRDLSEAGRSTFSAFTNRGNVRDLLPEGIEGSKDISYGDGLSVRTSVVETFKQRDTISTTESLSSTTE